jgi:hypothetical protein
LSRYSIANCNNKLVTKSNNHERKFNVAASFQRSSFNYLYRGVVDSIFVDSIFVKFYDIEQPGRDYIINVHCYPDHVHCYSGEGSAFVVDNIIDCSG